VRKYNGLDAEALYHPARLAPRLFAPTYGDYVLSVGRIESVKRVELLVWAMPLVDRPVRLVVTGEGTQRTNVERLVGECGVSDRVEFLGRSITSSCSSCTPMRSLFSIHRSTRISAT
jgi:glycosyltransferase involved in cell wall biosynthesis